MILRLFLSCCFALSIARAESTVSVAAAANLVQVMEPLTAAFTAVHPDIFVQTSFGASGSLVAQISHGAPYDVFLSADVDYPRALIATKHADETSLSIFVLGQLVLWTTKPGLEITDLATALRSPTVRKIAIANPATAPYGRAAQQVLEQLGLWTFVQPKLVLGENISQTAQFVDSGNAELGFVALSAVLSPQLKTHGHWLIVPPSLHAPLAQGAVLTTRGTTNPAARIFLKFLQSSEAQKLFARYGYGLPASP